VYHGVVRGEHRHRLLRRVSSGLVIVGGIVLAYPFWSAGYAGLQQGRLTEALAQSSAAFTKAARAETATVNALHRPQDRLTALASLFTKSLKPGDPVGRLKIPRIGLNKVVLEGEHKAPSLGVGNDQQYLSSGPTHYGLTPLPGAGRPFAVAGHRTTFGAPFFKLNLLRPGDVIIVTTPYARLNYTVDKLTPVAPIDISVLADRGYDLVLTTCNPPYSAAQRLIVWASLRSFTLL
jgi:sortase A